MLQRLRGLSLRLGGAAILGMIALPLLATAADDVPHPTPWPLGDAPSDLELSTLVSEALGLFERERWEEFREAR